MPGMTARQSRARRAKAKGQSDRRASTALTWEPDHLTDRHPLAGKARILCDAGEHNNRRRLGRVACGFSWEGVIREDERVVITAQLREPDNA